MNADTLKYLVRRIRTAKMAEPFQRVSSWMRHRKERREFRSGPNATSIERLWNDRFRWLRVEISADFREVLNQALEAAVPDGWWQDDSYWRSFSELYPEEARRLIADARMVMEGSVRLFQWREVELHGDPPWSETMEPGCAGEQWPQTYYADIHLYHDPARPDRDVKWSWELNRFQHLLCLGTAWRLTGDEKFPAEARRQMDSWMESERYPLGIHWNSNLEVGLRALSWARCHLLCINSAHWDRDFLARFAPCMYRHGLHLENELTVHHTAGNHLLGEASALFCLGLLYPLFADSTRWLGRSTRILNKLVPRIILPDGVYAEQTTGYFRFIAEFLLNVLHLAQHAGIELSDEVRSRLAAGMKFLKALSPDFREIPMIGDSDTGSAIGWQLSDFWDFSSLAASGAVLLDEPSLFDGLKSFPAEAFLLVGEKGLTAYEGHQRSRTQDGRDKDAFPNSVTFPHGGYQISRDDRFSLVFDTGRLGISPGYGHGHADGLSFVLNYADKPVIIDPGTFLYNGPLEWREYFRSTAAHNTLRIDGGQQAKPLDTFRWADPIRITQYPPRSGTDWRVFHGSVKWGSIVHHRFLLHILNGGLIIIDAVEGSGEHALEWSLHLDPDWEVRQMDARLFTVGWSDKEMEIFFIHSEAANHSLARGSIMPMAGWYSRYYGCRIPTTTLRSIMKTHLPGVMVFGIKPSGMRISLPKTLAAESLPVAVIPTLRSSDFIACAELHSNLEPVP
jgi:hypothetical protein